VILTVVSFFDQTERSSAWKPNISGGDASASLKNFRPSRAVAGRGKNNISRGLARERDRVTALAGAQPFVLSWAGSDQFRSRDYPGAAETSMTQRIECTNVLFRRLLRRSQLE